MKKHENKLFDDFVRGNNKTAIADLEARNFDGSYGLMLPLEWTIAKALKLGHMKWSSFLPDPLITIFNNHPWDMSSTLPLFHPAGDLLHNTGHFHLIQRTIMQLAPTALYTAYNGIILNPLRNIWS